MSTLPTIEPITGARFRELRDQLGVTQEALARALGCTSRTVQSIEKARDEVVDTRTALAIMKLVDDSGSSAVATPSTKLR